MDAAGPREPMSSWSGPTAVPRSAPGVVKITAQRVWAGRGGPEDGVHVSSRRPPGQGGAVSRLANELDQPVGDWPFPGDRQDPGLLGGVMTRLRAHGLRRGR
jgi:hypothetical protein